MNKKLLAFAGALACATGLQAKTVLWYHFDEAEPGTAATEASVIVDAVGTQNGVPEYWWNNGKSTNANFMPAYSNAFPVGCVWFDPVSGQRGSRNRCLHLKNPPLRGQYGNGEHGVVRIPDDPKFHLQTFTVEMFVKDLYLSDPNHTEVRLSSSPHCVVYKAGSWGLSILGGNGNGSDAVLKDIYREVDGTACNWSDGVNANMYPRTQRDGNWHHIALVVEGSDQSKVNVAVYVDYVKQYNASKTMEGPVAYQTSDIWLGRNPNSSNYGWGGLIDEFRISDTALAPHEMLRFVNPRTDGDTLLYLGFDDWFGNLFKPNPCGSLPNLYLVSEAGLVEAAVPVLTRRSTETPIFVSDCVERLRRDIAAETSYSNCRSFHPVPNSYNQTLGISYPLTGSRIVTKDDMTIEMYAKYTELPTVNEYLMRNCSLFAAAGKKRSWYVIANPNGKISFGVDWTKSISTPTPVLSDGQWHHLAWTVVKDRHLSVFYVDHVKVGEISDEELCPISPDDASDAGALIFCSYVETGWNSNCFTGLIDEIRVTGRPLEPQEFLTARTSSSAVLASASFEGNLDEGPADYADLFAAGTLSGSGGFAKTRPFKTDANRQSVRLDGATVSLGRNILLEQDGDFTLEFCLRPETVGPLANVVALKAPAPSDAVVWSVAFGEDRSSLVVRAGDDSASFAVPDLDGWWHHFGLVFAKAGDSSCVTLYVDHVQVGQTVPLTVAQGFPSLSDGLSIGSAAFAGWFDELRVTRGVLSPEDMMSCSPRQGGLLLLR